jgi:hypothetical protein
MPRHSLSICFIPLVFTACTDVSSPPIEEVSTTEQAVTSCSSNCDCSYGSYCSNGECKLDFPPWAPCYCPLRDCGGGPAVCSGGFCQPARTDEVTMDWFYLGLLNRAADAGGYAFWLNQLRMSRCNNPVSIHGELNSISLAFIYSTEFQGLNLSNQAYVHALYKGIFRRDADPGGCAYWVNELDSGRRTREDVRANFVFSAEFYNSTVAPIMSELCISN